LHHTFQVPLCEEGLSNVPTAHVVPIQKENGTLSQSKVVAENNNITIDKRAADEKSLSNDVDKMVLGSSYSIRHRGKVYYLHHTFQVPLCEEGLFCPSRHGEEKTPSKIAKGGRFRLPNLK
jgi:hypothetical protein